MPPRFALRSREDVLSGAGRTSDLSTAFMAEGEERLLLPLHASGRVLRGERPIVAALRTLLRALRERLGLETWFLAYGRSPDDLASAELLQRLPLPLRGDLPSATAAEAALGLAYLASREGPGLRLAPSLVRDFAREPGPAMSAALEVGARELEATIDEWIAAAPPEVGVWFADLSLGVRFSVFGASVTFRAHHPVIHAALRERCEKSGIDLA